MKCQEKNCQNHEENNKIVCINGYGFYCEGCAEDIFVSCSHCENLTEIPLKGKPQICEWCKEDISSCFM